MYFKITWDQDFADLMMHLWAKYGRDIYTENGIGDQLDLNKFSKNFFKLNTTTADISIDANANVSGKSVIDYNFEFPKPLQKYNSHYLLWKELKKTYGLLEANKIIEKQISGEIYINDFFDIGRPYCFNFSTYDIALEGLTMSRRMDVKPPKSLESFIRQMEQFIVYAANSTLGATGLADIMIVMGVYVEKIKKTRHDGHIKIHDLTTYISERLRSFIYTLNWEFRGNQSPFTNISVYDKYFLEDLIKDYIVDSITPTIETVQEIQKLYIKAMNEELKRTSLTFPVTTACFMVKNGEILDKKFLEFVAEQDLEFGFINFYYGDTSTLSSCCRLRSQTNNPYFNSFGAGSTKIGSLGVVTNNFPRLAYIAKKSDSPTQTFLKLIKKSVEITAKINHAKRKIIKKRIEFNSMPLYVLGHMNLSKQYSTYGVTGLSEALEILNYDITSEKGENFVIEILDIINFENDKMQNRFNAPHNCEQVPAESSAVKLAQRDKLLKFQNEYEIYSNQFIPLTKKADILERLRLQGKFDNKFSGGAICHINVDTKIKNKQILIDLMKYAAKTGTVYWCINYSLKRCKEDHVWIDGEMCPVCGESIDKIITRVVGFFTIVDSWNKVRRKEDYPNRVQYKKI